MKVQISTLVNEKIYMSDYTQAFSTFEMKNERFCPVVQFCQNNVLIILPQLNQNKFSQLPF